VLAKKKKKKKSGGYKADFRERKMRKMNPWVILSLYFLFFLIIAYPTLYVVFNYVVDYEMPDWALIQSSLALSVAGAAYYGVILKARREGREPRR